MWERDSWALRQTLIFAIRLRASFTKAAFSRPGGSHLVLATLPPATDRLRDGPRTKLGQSWASVVQPRDSRWLLGKELPLPLDLGLDRCRLQPWQPPFTPNVWKEIQPREGRNEKRKEKRCLSDTVREAGQGTPEARPSSRPTQTFPF